MIQVPRIKFSKILTNPYTGEEVEVKGSNEEVFQRRIKEQLEKWDNEQVQLENEEAQARYHLEQHRIARENNVQLKQTREILEALCYWNLSSLTPDLFFEENISKIHLPRRYRPSLEDAEKAVGLTPLKKILGKMPGKPRSELIAMQAKAKKLLDKQIEDYNIQREKDKEEYHQKRYKEEHRVNKIIKMLAAGSSYAANNYFSYILDQDSYSVNGLDEYHHEHSRICFSKNTGEIRFSYRIPNDDENNIIKKYEYDIKNDSIIAKKYDKKTATQWKLRIGSSVLLRAAALIFYSDYYNKITTISIIGYLRYFDSAYGNNQKKNVIHVNIPREAFNKIVLERVNPYDFFCRVLNATISSGLYEKEPYSIKEIE